MGSQLPIVVTPGDPLGVGAEVALGAGPQVAGRLVLVGEPGWILAEAGRQGVTLPILEQLEDAGEGMSLLVPPRGAEPVEVRAIRFGAEACLAGRARALVTGPIHKARLAAQGFGFPGHTDFLGELCGVEQPVMAFVGRKLRVVLATIHMPLHQVPHAITREGLLHVVRTAHAALRDQLGIPEPVLVVAGLNPHAGDQGVLGSEELDLIGPACDVLRAEGLLVCGPYSAEAAARDAAEGRADMLVAMYHDQGLVPLKVLDFGHAVNWTIGLPIVRTSVDHGTADDIAGKGIADSGSMLAALRLADRVSGQH
jgi:4-hydroxythreonine-4-phosphate dehydrogenase